MSYEVIAFARGLGRARAEAVNMPAAFNAARRQLGPDDARQSPFLRLFEAARADMRRKGAFAHRAIATTPRRDLIIEIRRLPDMGEPAHEPRKGFRRGWPYRSASGRDDRARIETERVVSL